ncbi:MAG: NAD(P)-dependent oxidoreductase, partial [Alphaproteobacteria bacterium]
EWTYLSPAAEIAPGERTGTFRLGGDQFLTDAEGRSRISAEDYAVALIEEVEKSQHIRQRFTVAY